MIIFQKKGKGAWGDALTSRLGKETLRDEKIAADKKREPLL